MEPWYLQMLFNTSGIYVAVAAVPAILAMARPQMWSLLALIFAVYFGGNLLSLAQRYDVFEACTRAAGIGLTPLWLGWLWDKVLRRYKHSNR